MTVILKIAAASVLAAAVIASLTGRVKRKAVIASGLTLAALCLAGLFLFRPAPAGESARQHRVYSGGTHKDSLTAVVSDSGRLYVRGDNHLLSIADRHGPFETLGWTCIMKNVKSYYHNNTAGSGVLTLDSSFALTFDGELYGWGFYDSKTNPRGEDGYYVKIMDDIADFACGSDCLAVKTNGELWTWGAQGEPARLTGGIRSVYACDGLNFAVDEDGAAFVWGKYAGEEIASPMRFAEDVRELSAAFAQDGSFYVQLLSPGGELSLLNISGLSDGTASPVKAARDVRGLCSFGYIDAGGTLRRWQDGEAVPVAEDVISADCSDTGAIYISDGGTLCAADSGNASIRRDPMLRFW